MALAALVAITLFAAATSAAAASSGVFPPLQLPTVSLAELQARSPTTLRTVAEAMTSFGMLAVSGFHREGIASSALSSFVSCATGRNIYMRQVAMSNGATRSTLATTTRRGSLQSLPADVLTSCPEFSANAYHLRTAAAAVGSAYAGILDQLMYGETACASSDQCYSGAIKDSESLEHFHLFEASTAWSDARPMLDMHSDIGLFLVMTAAELFSHEPSAGSSGAPGALSAKRAQDLIVQLADGSVVTPVLPSDSLLVMNGEGLTRWMRMPARMGLHPYSPLHEVLSYNMDGGRRAWFGRMFMPSPNATLQAGVNEIEEEGLKQGITFQQYRDSTYKAFKQGNDKAASAAGCSPSRRLLADEQSCGAGEVYCWMSCMRIAPNISCTKSEILCANSKNISSLWPRDYTSPGGSPDHCFDCTLYCPATGFSPSKSSFCNTNLGPSTMWMTGFQFAAGNEDDPCVVYLFPEWVLDSAGKFAGACIGTFFMGVLMGALGWVRKWLKDGWVAEGRWDPGYAPSWKMWLADAVLLLLVAIQLCLAYFLMLVAMTYQAELFIMVILGLALGHIFTRPQPRSSATVGPCRALLPGCAAADDAYKATEPCCSPP